MIYDPLLRRSSVRFSRSSQPPHSGFLALFPQTGSRPSLSSGRGVRTRSAIWPRHPARSPNRGYDLVSWLAGSGLPCRSSGCQVWIVSRVTHMPSASRRPRRQRRQRSKPHAGKSVSSRQPQASSQIPLKKEKPKRSDRIAVYCGIGGALVAVIAVIVAVLAYVNQRDANEATSLAALEQFASKVSYVVEQPQSGAKELVITNRSTGAISNLEMNFPQPVQGCSSPCTWQASFWAQLSNIPACEAITTNILEVFSHPSINSESLAGSDLVFTDQNGIRGPFTAAKTTDW